MCNQCPRVLPNCRSLSTSGRGVRVQDIHTLPSDRARPGIIPAVSSRPSAIWDRVLGVLEEGVLAALAGLPAKGPMAVEALLRECRRS